jgi:hypothetical protein
VEPILTAALTASAKQVAQQGFQASIQIGKERRRKRASIQERKDAYERFQDATVACLSTFMAAAAIADAGGSPTMQENAAERFLVDLTRDSPTAWVHAIPFEASSP